MKKLLFTAVVLFYSAFSFGQGNAQSVERAEVRPFGPVLFEIYGNTGSVDAATRAEIISNNIKKLRRDMLFNASDLTIKNNGTYDVVYHGKTILGVTDAQAKTLGTTKEALALEYRNLVADTVLKERAKNMPLMIARQAGLSILFILLTIIFIKVINKLFWRIESFAEGKSEQSADVVKQIIDTEKQKKFTYYLFNTLRWGLILLVVYLCMMAFLWEFPATRWIFDAIIKTIASPVRKALLAIWAYLPNLLEIAVVLVVFRLIAKGCKLLALRIENKEIKFRTFHPDWAMPTYQIIRMILIIFAFIFIFPLLPGANSTIFKGISVFIGVLFSLGSTSVINNIVSGFVITYMRPFAVGDHIKMGENDGRVIEKSMLVTRILTSMNEVITIPNSNILTAHTTNYTESAKSNGGMTLFVELTIGYDTNWRRVFELLKEAMLRTDGVLKTPQPFVAQKEFLPSSIRYMAVFFTDADGGYPLLRSAVMQNILDVCNENGVEILDADVVDIRNAAPGIPPEYIKNPEEKVLKISK